MSMLHRHSIQLTILLVAFVLIIMAGSSCSTLEIGIEQTSTPNIQLTEFTSSLATQNVIMATRISEPTATISTGLSSQPVARPSPTQPTAAFTNLQFAPEPDETLARRFYVEGTPRVFALWDYTGMQEGMLVRREWKRNNEDWIVREEPWAFNRYGSEGTVRDIYVFEDQVGLETGEYTLSLYINNIAQELYLGTESKSLTSFWVVESDIAAPVASPDKSHTAFVRFGGNLLIEYPNGDIHEIAQGQEIAAMAWFPDGVNLLYVERDRSKQLVNAQDEGITHKMFIIDIHTQEQRIIGAAGENFHSPIISPTGEYVSFFYGNHVIDGCTGSPGLAILELDSDLRRQAVYFVNSFTGVDVPNNDPSTIILSTENQARFWENDTNLVVNLEWLCKPTGQNPDGLYRLNLTNLTAERKD
jgi:hypothetical protein